MSVLSLLYHVKQVTFTVILTVVSCWTTAYQVALQPAVRAKSAAGSAGGAMSHFHPTRTLLSFLSETQSTKASDIHDVASFGGSES